MAYKQDESNIAERLSRLFRQLNLRILYAQTKVAVYDEERQKASATGKGILALKAQVAKSQWANYLKNVQGIREELIQSVKEALVGYGDNEKKIWYSYFIKQIPCERIRVSNLSTRSVQRIVAQMKAEMEFKFAPSKYHRVEVWDVRKWNACNLAQFLEENPSEEYTKAVKDLIDYNIIDMDALEFDQAFQDYLETGERFKKQDGIRDSD